MHGEGEHHDGGIDLDAGAVLFDRERNHIEDVYFSRNSGQNGVSAGLAFFLGGYHVTDTRLALYTQELCSTWETA